MLWTAQGGIEMEQDGPIQGCKPTVVAMVICDMVLRDERTKNVSLIGLFNQIQGPRVPMLHDRLFVFLSLTDGHGRQAFQLQCKAPDESVIFETRGEVVFNDPLEVTDAFIEIRGLLLPAAGIYTFEFTCGGELTLRRFLVMAPLAPPSIEPSNS
jgi:hypothetical protein